MHQTKSKIFQWLCKNSPVTLKELEHEFMDTSMKLLRDCPEVLNKTFNATTGIDNTPIVVIVNDRGFVAKLLYKGTKKFDLIAPSHTKIYFAPKPIDIQRIYDEEV